MKIMPYLSLTYSIQCDELKRSSPIASHALFKKQHFRLALTLNMVGMSIRAVPSLACWANKNVSALLLTVHPIDQQMLAGFIFGSSRINKSWGMHISSHCLHRPDFQKS